MRPLKTTVLIAGLALWASMAVARHAAVSPSQKPAQQSPASQPASQTTPGPQAPVPPAQPTLSGPPPQSAMPPYSADTLYNLANSYARAGKPGLAVLNYERATLLAPNDPDINANLEYVRTTAHIPTAPRTRFTQIARFASPNTAAWLGVVGIALLGAGLVANKVSLRFRRLRVLSVLLGIGLIALTVANAVQLWPRIHEAVVLINQTPARVSPVPMGDTLFVLREAETVTMTAEHEEFVLIRTRSGKNGWVARASLGAVLP